MKRHGVSTTIPFYSLLKNVANVISYKITLRSDDTMWSPIGPTVKETLLANPRLEILHLLSRDDEIRDLKLDKWDRRKLPPVKELVIRNLLGWEFFRICDWSCITYLELVNVSNVAMIENILPEELSRLKILVIACECRDRAERQNQLQRLNGYLITLLSHTSDLEKLSLKCGVCDLLQNRRGFSLTSKSLECREPNDCVRTISQHCKRLHSLELRTFDGPRSLPWKWILLSAIDLEIIRYSCPSLMELSLDARTFLYGRHPRLDTCVNAALSKFRNLRRVTVHTLIPYSPPEAGLLPHHQARAISREWVENVQRLKEGVKFERLTVNVEIERLGVDDEFQRVYQEDDWRVCLTYMFEASKGVSWSVTGEERSIEFKCR